MLCLRTCLQKAPLSLRRGSLNILSSRFQTSAFLRNKPFEQEVAPSGLWNMLESSSGPSAQVGSVGPDGIALADGVIIKGPCIFLEGKTYLWNAPPSLSGDQESWKEWNQDMLEVFDVIVPKPELVIFGTGKSIVLLPPFVKSYFVDRGIGVELMDTRNACSTYNVLSEEGRRVAAALLPIVPYRWEKEKL